MSRRVVAGESSPAELAPGDAAILDTLGWAYLRNSQFNEALQTFSDLFSLEAHHFSGWKGVFEVAQCSVEPEVFLRFCDDVAQIAAKEQIIFPGRLPHFLAHLRNSPMILANTGLL